MGISFVQGRFDKFDGKAATGGANLDNADLNFSISVPSINTGVDMRDRHLISEEFFDVAKYLRLNLRALPLQKIKQQLYR